MESTITLRDPVDLRVHKLIADMPQLAEEDQEFENLCRSVHETGHLIEPLKITSDNAIVDGRHRWRAAKRCQLPQIPCIVVEEDEVATIALDTLMGRRHLTKGQMAYIAYPLFKAAHEEARQRQLDRLKSGNRGTIAHSVRDGHFARKVEDFASKLGVSERLFEQAAKLHDIFTRDTTHRDMTYKDGTNVNGVTFKEFYEPRILRSDKPYGLGDVLAGIGSIQDAEANPGKRRGGKPTELSRQLQLFERVILTDELNRWDYWQSCGEEEKAEHFARVRRKAATLPQDQCEELADYHAKLAAEFRKSAKRQEVE